MLFEGRGELLDGFAEDHRGEREVLAAFEERRRSERARDRQLQEEMERRAPSNG